MEHANTSSENLAAALKLLEEAARQKTDELKSVMSDKYTHLRNVVVETDATLMKAVTAAQDRALEAAVHARDVSVAKAREITRDVDHNVHHHAWQYIAGTAAVGLLLGYILGQSRNK